MYDLIILGGGPAGSGAAVYAARKLLKTAVITTEFGGQSSVSETIYNWIGTKEIRGEDLANNLKEHVSSYKSEHFEVFEGEKIKEILKEDTFFKVITESGKDFSTKAIIITTGSGRRKLNVPGATEYENKGITYCASCDGPMFTDMDVVVIGGGNAGFETAMQLVAYCKTVTLIELGPDFKADKITVQKISNNLNFKSIKNANILKVDGDKFIKSLTYKDKETGEEKTISTNGVFVEIGQVPNTSFVKDIVMLDQLGRIVVDPTTQITSCPGIWAAGDCTNGKYHQNNIAVGDAIKAIEDAYIWIKNN
jgi:alkyl hydroperoxide reductase subunit F